MQKPLGMVSPCKNERVTLAAPRIWVATAAALNLAGWGLSWVGGLNTAGYGVLVGSLVICFLSWRFFGGRGWFFPQGGYGVFWRRMRRRFKRPLPLCFLLLAVLVFAGGCLYPPNNYDALSYRFPRVLNWLAEHRWHWIHTQDPRMNTHVCGSEWLLAPWLALTKSDRWVFLINAAGFLLLPGLVFSVFRRLGVRARVAWNWMWLLPSGYNFILQAGGSANDIVGAVHALAAMHFALRARESRRVSDAWFALFAAALLTGSKLSNLPLLLPIALALLPSVRLLIARPFATAAVCVLAASASVMPMCWHNIQYCGDWSGNLIESRAGEVDLRIPASGAAQESKQEPPPERFAVVIKNPLVGISGNSLILACENFIPPVFPFASWWNNHIKQYFPVSYQEQLKRNFMPSFLTVRELQGEESAGIGFGLSWLLAAGLLAAWYYARTKPAPGGGSWGTAFALVLLWSPVVSLLFYMTKCGITSAARIVAPYYALLIPIVVASRAYEQVVRTRWWRRASLAVFVVAFGVLALAPERPLWPAQTVLAALNTPGKPHPLIERAQRVYSVYRDRYDAFAPIRELVPGETRNLGMICVYDEAGTSLWRPFNQRRVRQVLFSDDRKQLDQWGIQYMVVRDFGPEMNPWLEHVGAEVVARKQLVLFAGREPVDWCLVRLR